MVRKAYLMGTETSLEVYAQDRERGLNQLEEFLVIMERTEAELTNWRDDSTVSQFNVGPVDTDFLLNIDLCRLLGKVMDLHRLSGGTFDPAIGHLRDVWALRKPASPVNFDRLERARAESGLKYLSFTREECLVSKRENILLDTGAFGKGEALYRIRIHSNKVDSDPWLVNLGGQIAVQGLPPGRDAWEVDISFPSDRERPYTTVKLVGGSLATSGISVKGKHILDPRTGRPSSFCGAVTVWHDNALYADALSTALHVMGPEQGIEWADRQGIAACFLSVSASGHVQVRKNRFFDPLVSP